MNPISPSLSLLSSASRGTGHGHTNKRFPSFYGVFYVCNVRCPISIEKKTEKTRTHTIRRLLLCGENCFGMLYWVCGARFFLLSLNWFCLLLFSFEFYFHFTIRAIQPLIVFVVKCKYRVWFAVLNKKPLNELHPTYNLRLTCSQYMENFALPTHLVDFHIENNMVCVFLRFLVLCSP